MLVHQILKAKQSGEAIFTIKPTAAVHDAAVIMAEKRIGALIVSEDGEVPVGIVSERDIVRELGLAGNGCLILSIGQLMTPNPVCCSCDSTAEEVMKMMSEGRFRHMPVTEDGKMVGLITQGDLVKTRLDELAMERNALEGMIMGY